MSDAELKDLHDALGNLVMVHHAMATAAVDNNRESLSSRLSDLEAAGKNLGTYYKTLRAQQQ